MLSFESKPQIVISYASFLFGDCGKSMFLVSFLKVSKIRRNQFNSTIISSMWLQMPRFFKPMLSNDQALFLSRRPRQCFGVVQDIYVQNSGVRGSQAKGLKSRAASGLSQAN